MLCAGALGDKEEKDDKKEMSEEEETELAEARREEEERRADKYRKMEEERETMRQGIRDKVGSSTNQVPTGFILACYNDDSSSASVECD